RRWASTCCRSAPTWSSCGRSWTDRRRRGRRRKPRIARPFRAGEASGLALYSPGGRNEEGRMSESRSDIEIARAADKKPITEIGARLGIPAAELLPYGHDKAKVSAGFIRSLADRPAGRLVLVTAINPTPAGEG